MHLAHGKIPWLRVLTVQRSGISKVRVWTTWEKLGRVGLGPDLIQFDYGRKLSVHHAFISRRLRRDSGPRVDSWFEESSITVVCIHDGRQVKARNSARYFDKRSPGITTISKKHTIVYMNDDMLSVMHPTSHFLWWIKSRSDKRIGLNWDQLEFDVI